MYVSEPILRKSWITALSFSDAMTMDSINHQAQDIPMSKKGPKTISITVYIGAMLCYVSKILNLILIILYLDMLLSQPGLYFS